MRAVALGTVALDTVVGLFELSRQMGMVELEGACLAFVGINLEVGTSFEFYTSSCLACNPAMLRTDLVAYVQDMRACSTTRSASE